MDNWEDFKLCRAGPSTRPLATTEVELFIRVSCRSVIVGSARCAVPCAELIVPIASTSGGMIAIPSGMSIVGIGVRIPAQTTNRLHLNVFAYMCLEAPASLDGVMHVLLRLWIPVAQASKLGKTIVTCLGDDCACHVHSR